MSKRITKTTTEPNRNGEAVSARHDVLQRAQLLGVKPFTSLEEYAGDPELTAEFDVDEFLRQVRESRDQPSVGTAK